MPPSEGEPTREYLCEIAEKLIHSPFFGIVIGKLVVALIGFICSTYTFLNEGIKWLVHPNAKVLFFSHALITVFTAVVYIGVYSFEIYRISFPHSEVCGYLLSDVTAFWVRFPMNTLFCLQTVIMFTFVVERTISTIWPEEYEQISNPKHCIIICFFVMSAGVVFTFCLLALPNKYEGYSTAVGAKTKDNFFEGSIAVMETATMGILYWSTVESIRQTKELQRRKESHLGNKYQISENRNILLLLLPCFTINGLLHLFSSCGVIVYSFISENKFQPESMAIVVDSVNQSILYTIIMPLAIFIRKRCLLKRKAVVHSYRHFDEHFKQMHDVWK